MYDQQVSYPWMSKVYGIYSAYGICTMQCYSVFTGHRPLSFAAMFVNLEHIMLNKISQAQKDKNLMMSFLWNPGKRLSKKERHGIVNGSWGGWGVLWRGWLKGVPGFIGKRSE